MMKFARVVAELDEDSETKIVILTRMSEIGELDKDFESFGYSKNYVEDGGLEKYPFILSWKNGGGIIYSGPDDVDNTNIYSKPIKHGEYFTRQVDGDDWTYRISSITQY